MWREYYIPKRRGFSNLEVRDLIISVIALSLAFSIGNFAFFPFYLLVIAPAFALHELAHKFTAIRFGCTAEYRMFPQGLLLALLLAFISRGAFIFAAPGAVMIYSPYLRRRENGIIAFAGPLTNLAIGFFLFFISIFFASPIFELGYRINFFLAAFNLLPIPPLDGSKVMMWDVKIWAMVTILSFFLVGYLVM